MISHKRKIHGARYWMVVDIGPNKKLFKNTLPKKKVNKPIETFNWEELKTTEDNRVICQRCDKIFTGMKSAKQHYKELHMIDKNALNFKCKFCMKVFAVERYMNAHIFNIHGIAQKIHKNVYKNDH